ncbi:MAG TPA: carboxypeptidase regulatory-like domain-containing protein [Polyangiaceae bacterium]|nr:carboxypeptidase regulatory-like domain-containing protein [Polyangiaceae bacterium]
MAIHTIHRCLLVLAALICMLFAAGLSDTPPVHLLVETVSAPPLPDSVRDRNGTVSLSVKDANGAPVAGARVTFLLIRDRFAWLAASRTTDDHGHLIARDLPRGELWILAQAEGRSRASTRLILAGEPREVALVSRPAGHLDVRVSGDDDKPVAGARVELRCGDPLPFLAKTNAKGIASLDRLCPPPYEVVVTADGYDSSKRSSLQPGPLPYRVSLKKLGSILVNVVDPQGAPAPLAFVYLAGAGVWPARHTRANAFGNAVIAGLPSGAYDLRAVRGDEASRVTNAVSVDRGNQAKVTLTLEAGRRIAVYVVDSDGPDAQPVPNANVVLVEGGLSSFPLEGKTDGSGAVTLGPIAGSSLSVSARADGFVSTTAVSVPSDASEVRVALVRGGTLLGDVVDSRGFPVPGATIEVVGTDPSGLPIDESPSLQAFRAAHFSWALAGPPPLIPAGELGVMPGPIPPIPHGASIAPAGVLRPGGDAPPPADWVTDREGNFSIHPIPPGRVRAIVRHPGFVEAVSELVTLTPGGSARVHVVLITGGTLEGRVVDDRGFPVASARVQITAHNGSSERSTLTADDGTFAFASVHRDLIVTVSRPSNPVEPAYQARIAVGNDERKSLDIVLRAERDPVAVTVQDDRGYPIDAVQVTAISLSKESSLRSTSFTGKDGVASIPDAAGVAIRFEVSAPGYATLIKIVQEAPKELKLSLVPGVRVRGRITARNGRDRLDDALVTAYVESGARHLRTDKDGNFQMTDLAPGSLKLRVEHKEYVAVEKVVTIGEPNNRERIVELDPINLDGAGSVEGEVIDERGDPVVGARVAKDAVPTWLPVGPLPPGVVATNARGEFELGGLPEGRVTLEALLPDQGRGKVHGVEVLSNRTTRRIRITLHKTEDSRSSEAGAGLLVTLRDATAGASGVVVRTVAAGSTAERAGIMPGDVIVRIDGVVPSSAGDAQRKLAGPENHDVLVELQRGKQTLTLRAARERIRQ